MMALARAEARGASGDPCALVAHAEADVWRTLDAADRSRTAMALHGQDAASTVPAAMVETAVRNLLDNALRYSPPASMVELELMVHPAAQNVVVTISDSGRGLRAEQMAQAGTRF